MLPFFTGQIATVPHDVREERYGSSTPSLRVIRLVAQDDKTLSSLCSNFKKDVASLVPSGRMLSPLKNWDPICVIVFVTSPIISPQPFSTLLLTLLLPSLTQFAVCEAVLGLSAPVYGITPGSQGMLPIYQMSPIKTKNMRLGPVTLFLALASLVTIIQPQVGLSRSFLRVPGVAECYKHRLTCG